VRVAEPPPHVDRDHLVTEPDAEDAGHAGQVLPEHLPGAQGDAASRLAILLIEDDERDGSATPRALPRAAEVRHQTERRRQRWGRRRAGGERQGRDRENPDRPELHRLEYTRLEAIPSNGERDARTSERRDR